MNANLHLTIFFTLLILAGSNLSVQDLVIKPESSDNLLSLLKEEKVENLRIITSDEELLTIEIRCKGLENSEKQVLLSGVILNDRKKELNSIICDPTQLPKGASNVDLTFRATNAGNSKKPYINSKYIKVVVSIQNKEEDGGSLLDDLSSIFGNESDTGLEGLTSDVYLFKYNKEWRIPGNKDMIITVSFTPVGKSINAKM